MRPLRLVQECYDTLFQSTHPLRGATAGKIFLDGRPVISIHAPLAGCDLGQRCVCAGHRYFNPRTPCGVRLTAHLSSFTATTFQSTHPLRGATEGRRRRRQNVANFNPRTPCGVRHDDLYLPSYSGDFNPRTPCGVRLHMKQRKHTMAIFQSTHPLRGATNSDGSYNMFYNISIHAPLAGCDVLPYDVPVTPSRFQSTHPLRGATSASCPARR